MKKMLLAFLLRLLLGGGYPAIVQLVAHVRKPIHQESQPKTNHKRLRDVLQPLKEHCRVDILFFDRNPAFFVPLKAQHTG